MAKPRKPWNIRLTTTKNSVTATLKAEVETNAKELIDKVLKPKHVLPPPDDARFNHITDIGAKWHRNYFYFFAIYAVPGPNALVPSFESKFARIEPLGNGKFALYGMRHTGKEWVGILDDLTVDECMNSIQNDPWFEP